MICYRDRSFCADQEQCAVPDDECDRRLTYLDAARATGMGLPVARVSFMATCGMFRQMPARKT